MEWDVKSKKQSLRGEVISDTMDKTIVVKVDRTYKHPRLHKIMRKSKKYKVHDADELAKVGDVVEIFEGNPKSKTKYMYLSRILKSEILNEQSI